MQTPPNTNVESILKAVGAVQNGHFLLSSGLHSDQYMQCQKVMQYPRHALALAEEMTKQVIAAGLKPQTVAGPALGAIHWEVFVATCLDKALGAEPVKAIFAERPDGTEFQIRRGVEISPGEKVLIVEDVTTTGSSVKKVLELIGSLGGEPLAVATIVDRSGGQIDFGVPFLSLMKAKLATYQPDVCPMCKQGQPVIKPGSTKLKT